MGLVRQYEHLGHTLFPQSNQDIEGLQLDSAYE